MASTDFYGPLGWGAEPLRERLEHRERIALELLVSHRPTQLGDTPTIADFGCGDGLMLRELGARIPGAKLSGFDLSPTQLEKALARLPESVLGLADLSQRLEISEGAIDIAYAGELVEHLWSPDDFLDELHRVVRPGGLVIVTTPNLLSWFNRCFALAGLGPVYVEYSTRDASIGMGPLRRIKAGNTPVGHIRVMSARALRDLATAAGFEILALRGACFEAAPRPVRTIDVAVGRVVPSLGGILVCALRRP